MSGRNHFDRTFSINLAEFIYLFTFFESVEMIWTGNSCPVYQTQRFFLESNDKVCCMAGLLTCFCGRRLPGRIQWLKRYVPVTLHETYSSGTVQDSHLIPF